METPNFTTFKIYIEECRDLIAINDLLLIPKYGDDIFVSQPKLDKFDYKTYEFKLYVDNNKVHKVIKRLKIIGIKNYYYFPYPNPNP
jgi:hypothetical protein